MITVVLCNRNGTCSKKKKKKWRKDSIVDERKKRRNSGKAYINKQGIMKNAQVPPKTEVSRIYICIKLGRF